MEGNSIFGYDFGNPALLAEALTTPSFKTSNPGATDNQRLEFLGDAVLGMIVAARLCERHPHGREGELTVRRAQIVSTRALCEAASRHGLAARLKRNKGAGPLPSNAKTLADAVEAVIGAAYVDGGLAAAEKIVGALELWARGETDMHAGNPKGELQTRAQALDPPRAPVYRLLDCEGAAHEPVFTVEVSVEGIGKATASAHNRREAESRAAARLLPGFGHAP